MTDADQVISPQHFVSDLLESRSELIQKSIFESRITYGFWVTRTVGGMLSVSAI